MWNLPHGPMEAPLAGIKVSVEGVAELKASLTTLSRATARNALKRALVAAAKPTVQAAKSKAPVLEGVLKRSITVSSEVVNNTGKGAYAKVMREGGTKQDALKALRDARRGSDALFTSAAVAIGPAIVDDQSSRKNRVLEFGGGRGNRAPQPFLRPAWDETKGQVEEIIARELSAQIAKSIARTAARRAAKRK